MSCLLTRLDCNAISEVRNEGYDAYRRRKAGDPEPEAPYDVMSARYICWWDGYMGAMLEEASAAAAGGTLDQV